MLFTWCFVYATVNCLPTDSSISGKLFDDKHHRSPVIANSSPASTDASENPPNAFDTAAVAISGSLDRVAGGVSIPHESLVAHKRVKRLHIFRPLFAYRQQQVKKRRILAQVEHENEVLRRIHEQRRAYHHVKLPEPCPCSYCDCSH